MSISNSGSTTTVQQSQPLNSIQPYLFGSSNTTGLFPGALNQYQSGGWSPQMQTLTDNFGTASNNMAGNNAAATYQLGNDLLARKYDPNVQSVSNISGANAVNAPTVQYDPLGASNNPYLAGMQQSYTNNAMNQYNDAVQNMAQQVLPQEQNSAVAVGGYGGSRQGIAEGMLNQQLARNARDLGVASMGYGSQLYGNAYTNAQNLAYQAAAQNAGMNLQGQLSNAQNQLGAQEFNANLGLQNNTQQMQLSAQQLANSQAGINAYQNTAQQQTSNYLNQLNLLQQPNAYNWNNLNNYGNVVMNGAHLGGTTTQSNPYFTNPLGNALGLASAGLGLYNGLQSSGLLDGLLGSGTGDIAAGTSASDVASSDPNAYWLATGG